MRVHCPTCLELFTPEEDLRSPPCGHVFHHECIQKWLRNKRGSAAGPDCPQCRKPADLNSLMRIYLAEADCDSQEDGDKDFERKLDDMEQRVELAEAERNSMFDRVVELEDDLKEKVEQLTKEKLEQTRMKSDFTVLREKLNRYESEKKETEKLKNKWLTSKKLLQDLEEKQGILKVKLSKSEKIREELEKQRKQAERDEQKAENELEYLNITSSPSSLVAAKWADEEFIPSSEDVESAVTLGG